jgi:predicted ATPase
VDTIWPGVTISETALPQAIVAGRRALGDGADGARFIETVRGRGYRFVADVVERRAPGAPMSVDSLVGRTGALAALEQMLREAVSGRGGVVLVSGDAGSGRTRMVRELADRARAAGARAILASCDDEGRAVELWPWMQLVQGLAEGAGDVPARVAAWLEAGAQPAPAAPTDADGAHAVLFDAIARLLRNRATATPLLLVLDDVDSADAASLRLARAAARALRDSRVLVVATYRDASLARSEALARTVGAMVREAPARHVTLPPLDRADVVRMAQARLTSPPDEATIDRLLAKTGGNPLLLVQLLYSMSSSSASGGAPGMASTSVLVSKIDMREAVEAHLARLSAPCRNMLEGAAVLGPAFSLGAIAATLGVDAAAIVDLVEEAVAARVLAREAGATGRYRFEHLLERDVAYAKLAVSRRVALHGRAADALDATGDAEDAARHRARAKALLGQG